MLPRSLRSRLRRSRMMGLPVMLAPVLLASVMVALVLLSPVPVVAQALGDDITVVGDRWAIQFPGLVAFDMSAQSGQEIVEIQLRYRPVDSRIWTYAYPNFEPGRQVTATFNLSVNGAGFIPPGTRLEYYYIIRDAQGNVHQTQSTVLEYTDTRFTWEQTRIGPLILLHHDIPQSRVASVTKGMDEELKRLAELLEVEDTKPIKGIIYNDRTAAIGAFPYQSRTITEQHVFEGFAFPDRGVFVGLGLSPRLVVHESAHVLLHRTMGAAASRMPAWLDEGFASYMEPDSAPYSGESLSSLAMPLEAMSRVHGTPKEIRNFYVKSESVVAYLLEEHGIERFRHFLGQFRQGKPVHEGLVSTYGFDLASLEDLWSADTRGRPASGDNAGARPSLFIYFDVWIFGLLALVVMFAVLVRYGVNKLRPNQAPGEGLQPWEDPDVLERQEGRADRL